MNTVLKRILVWSFAIILILTCCGFSVDARPQENEISLMEETQKVRVKFYDDNLETYTKEELEQLIVKYQLVQENAHILAEAARNLGWLEDSEAILKAKDEWENAKEAIVLYQEQIENLEQQEFNNFWSTCAVEYPAATEIWLYMRNLGWNDYVCAGIMGNLMAEVGGGTLDIQYWLYGANYYGMCQWNKAYANDIWGADLQTQCDYLRDTIKYEIDTFGYAYSKGFNYESFLNLTNERDVALAFATCYERCASQHRYIRQNYATKAYEYFVEE